jgi:hypothetical protein
MASATIKLFLPRGDAKSLRTAEISNWTGKVVAAPRTELDELLACEELDKAGVYILIGSDPLTNALRAYIGEVRGRCTKNGFASSYSRVPKSWRMSDRADFPLRYGGILHPQRG